MSSLDETFELLRAHLRQPELLNPAQSDPLFYFVHEPSEALDLKQKIHVWSSVLANEGWTVEQVSFSKLLWEIVDHSGRWEEWLGLEQHADPDDLNEAIRDVLRADNALIRSVTKYVTNERPRTIVFLTDAATLHPYFRLRAIESALHDKLKVPVVVFYPGRRSGQYGLHFLGFYSFDGNYRATLLGGLE